MAHLYVKTPGGTLYSIDLTTVNSSGGSADANGYALMNNGCTLQWGETSGGNATVTFPIAYSSDVYAIVGSAFGGNNTFFITGTTTRSSFYNDCDRTVYWMSIGK